MQRGDTHASEVRLKFETHLPRLRASMCYSHYHSTCEFQCISKWDTGVKAT